MSLGMLPTINLQRLLRTIFSEIMVNMSYIGMSKENSHILKFNILFNLDIQMELVVKCLAAHIHFMPWLLYIYMCVLDLLEVKLLLNTVSMMALVLESVWYVVCQVWVNTIFDVLMEENLYVPNHFVFGFLDWRIQEVCLSRNHQEDHVLYLKRMLKS
jgi:hypothetical protein